MLERLACACSFLFILTFGVPLVQEFTKPTEAQALGLFDLWKVEAEKQQLERVAAAQREFWDLRNSKLPLLLQGKLTLRQAADALRLEAEHLSGIFPYDRGWPERGEPHAIAAHLCAALRYQLADMN